MKKSMLFKCNKTASFVVSMCFILSFSQQSKADLLDFGKDLLKGSSKTEKSTSGLSSLEVGSGLKEALTVGAGNVVNQLGKSGGFNNDPAIHIPLPGSLKTVKKTLGKLGMGGMLEDLESKMNSAAEDATPKAKHLFVNAIKEMTLDDAKAILNGQKDSATRYFQSKMSTPLAAEMTPVVADSLASVGAVKSYDNVMSKYEDIPFVPDAKANMTEYVVEKSMDGIFHYLAVEEAAIRENPVKRTTALLKKVFGQ